MINPILKRQFGDPIFLAGELTKVFNPVKTYDEDKYRSLHLHNDMIAKIYSLIGENDTEFRYEVSRLIYRLGDKNARKEKKPKRRTVKTG